ncbi:glutamate receptor 2.8 [Rosa chinensis]|nr:glutamate receptor 2.8 [Rosa chinensis]
MIPVGLVLDDYSSVRGKILFSVFQMALSDISAYHPSYKTRLVLKTRESKKNVVGAAAAALNLIKNEEVQAIIGPVTSMETSFVINLGDQTHVPIISFSATSPSLTSLRSSYFFQFAQNDTSQVKAISAVINNYGWRQVVPIYIDTSYGEAVIPFLTDALQEIGVSVPYRSVISPSATDDQIANELYKLMIMQTRVFIVHMTTDLSSKLFAKAEEIGMMVEGYVWLTTSGITNRLTSLNSSVIHSMNGAIGVQTHVQKTAELEEFKLRWKRQFQKDHPHIVGAELDVFGFWAYDATFALAMAIEQVIGNTSSFDFQKPNASKKSTDILDSFSISPYGPKLCKALSTTRFPGIAGDLMLIDGQLQSSNFRIINVNGRGARTIGFWTPHHGLVSKMNYSTSHLGPVIWPGESLSVPKGWEIPTKGKRLRIGVPVKDGFFEFVKVTKDPTKNTTDATGFSIDVFKAVVEKLPYAISYDFIPFAKPDGTTAGNYNDMCYQVYLGNFDAVVGDTTIRANRSLYVDFTMPYADTGVVMVVPVVDTNKRSACAFLKPWEWDIWLAIIISLLSVGFVVWAVEHHTNEDFRGKTAEQEVGKVVWFSFSTMVFAHHERVDSNLARLVMSIWIFVVLVLTINYQASLTSIYTVEKLEPTITSIQDILKKGENIGYIASSFTYETLKQVGFEDSKLRAFGTMEAIDDALSNSGIAGFVDETPYMKLFLARYCNKYTMIGPIFKTDGFGFVFPKRSPLLPDVSQAVLNITGGETILNIENTWFKKDGNCEDVSNPKVSSNKLDLRDFRVLFITTLVASGLALIIYIIRFSYKYRDVWNSETSICRRIGAMLKKFLDIDPNSHTFRGQQPDVVTTFPNNNSPESPVLIQNSNHSNTNYVSSDSDSDSGQQRTSAESPAEVHLLISNH